jgi:VWFA-related protein
MLAEVFAQLKRRAGAYGVILFWTLTLAGIAAGAQNPATTFSSGTDLVIIDAVVLDKQGQPVSGLTQDDFIVKEDGELRKVLSFEAFPEPTLAADPNGTASAVQPGASVTSTTAAGRPPGRTFVLFFDDVFIGRELVDATRATALGFLRGGMRSGDRVLVANTSGDLRADELLPDGTPALQAAINALAGRNALGMAPGNFVNTQTFRGELKPSNRTELGAMEAVRTGRARGGDCEIEHQRRDRVRQTARALVAQIDRLAATKGRKALFLLSQGILQDDGPELRTVAAAAREANVVVYFVDVRGMASSFTDSSASIPDPINPNAGSEDARRAPDAATLIASSGTSRDAESAGAASLAVESGGTAIRNTNDLVRNMIRAADESRAFYLLGFAAGSRNNPDKWRKLEVRTRSGARVKARRGYTLRRPRLENDGLELPVDTVAYAFETLPGDDKTRAVVAVEFDAAAQNKRGAVRAVEFSVSLRQRDTGKLFAASGRAPVSVGTGESPAWRALSPEFELPQGIFDVHVALRDPASNAMGTSDARLQVPAPTGLRLSTPVLTDRVLKAGANLKPRAALGAHRAFRTGGFLYCEFEVFGAAASPATQIADVVAGVRIVDATGSVVRDASATAIVADEHHRLVRLVGMNLAGLPSGEFTLQLRVRDRTTGAEVEYNEPFILE